MSAPGEQSAGVSAEQPLTPAAARYRLQALPTGNGASTGPSRDNSDSDGRRGSDASDVALVANGKGAGASTACVQPGMSGGAGAGSGAVDSTDHGGGGTTPRQSRRGSLKVFPALRQKGLARVAGTLSPTSVESSSPRSSIPKSLTGKGRTFAESPQRRWQAAGRAVGMAQVMEKDLSARMFERAIHGTTMNVRQKDSNAARQRRMPACMLLPNSTFNSVWDSVSLLLIFLNVITVPYWVAFDVQTTTAWLVVDILIDAWFVVDIILNFRTAYIDDGDLQTDNVMVAKHYLSTYFTLDVIATFPFSVFMDDVLAAVAADRYAELPTLLRMVRLVRLVKIIRLFKAKRNFGALAELGVASRTVMRVLWLTFWMTAVGHVLGCFWVLVFTVDNNPNGWAYDYNVNPNDSGEMYLSALYFTFATLTTVGFGDVSANTNAERVYALVLMLVGAVLFATIVGRMSALATAVNQKAAEHQQIHDNLAEFMRRREIPKPLRQRMRAYFQYKTLHNYHVRDDATIAELSPALRREVLLHINKRLIHAVPFLRHAQAGFVNHIVTKLSPVHCIPRDYIVMAGEVGDFLYMLRRGEVDVVSPGGYVVKVLHQGSFFGEIACLYGCPRTASVRARTPCTLLSLAKPDLVEALGHYPSFAEGLAIVAKARMENKGPEHLPNFDARQHRCVTPPNGLASWQSVHSGNAEFHTRAVQFASNLLKGENGSLGASQVLGESKQGPPVVARVMSGDSDDAPTSPPASRRQRPSPRIRVTSTKTDFSAPLVPPPAVISPHGSLKDMLKRARMNNGAAGHGPSSVRSRGARPQSPSHDSAFSPSPVHVARAADLDAAPPAWVSPRNGVRSASSRTSRASRASAAGVAEFEPVVSARSCGAAPPDTADSGGSNAGSATRADIDRVEARLARLEGMITRLTEMRGVES